MLLVGRVAVGEASGSSTVLVFTGHDAELLARIRGQTADLSWRLVETDAAPAREEPLTDATRMARRAKADVVVWVESSEERGFNVSVADVEHGDLLVRRVDLGTSGGPMAASASAEAVALVIRSVLVSLSSGERMGMPSAGGSSSRTPGEGDVPVDGDEAASARDEVVRVPPAHSAVRDDPPEAARSRSRGAAQAQLEMGLAAGVDSSDAAPWFGPSVSAGVRLSSRWELAASGAYGTRRTLSDSLTSLELERYEGRVRAAYLALRGASLEVGAFLAGGVVAYGRTTTSVAAGVVATADHVALGPLGSAGALVRLLPGSLPLAFALELGADAVPRAPILRYARPTATTERARIWPIQPRAALTVQLRADIF